MKTLEELLKNFGCKKAFNMQGNFTKKASEAYARIHDFLVSISILTEISTEKIRRELDKISDENQQFKKGINL